MYVHCVNHKAVLIKDSKGGTGAQSEPSSCLLLKVSKTLEEFDVEERPSSVLETRFPNLTVIHSAVQSLNTKSRVSSYFARYRGNWYILTVALNFCVLCP